MFLRNTTVVGVIVHCMQTVILIGVIASYVRNTTVAAVIDDYWRNNGAIGITRNRTVTGLTEHHFQNTTVFGSVFSLYGRYTAGLGQPVFVSGGAIRQSPEASGRVDLGQA